MSHIETPAKVSGFIGAEQLGDAVADCDIVVIPAGLSPWLFLYFSLSLYPSLSRSRSRSRSLPLALSLCLSLSLSIVVAVDTEKKSPDVSAILVELADRLAYISPDTLSLPFLGVETISAIFTRPSNNVSAFLL